MEYTKKELKESALEFKVSISQQEMEDSRISAIKRLGKGVKVKGFRKGHAPLDILASSINPIQLMDAQLQLAIDQAVQKLIFENDLKLLTAPTVSIDKMDEGEQGLKITVKANCLPTVKLPDFSKIKYDKVEKVVADEDVESVINNLRNAAAKKKTVERPVKDGDEVVINFTGIHNGVEFEGGSAKKFNLTIGSGTFIPGFEEQIIGHQIGETFDIDVKFPDDYGAKNLAGEPAVFRVELLAINEIELPELNDEFAKSWAPDLGGMDDLRNDIRRELQSQADSSNQQATQANIQSAILDKIKIDLSDDVVEAKVQEQLDDIRSRSNSAGQSFDNYLDQVGMTEKEFAEKEIKPNLIKSIKSQAVFEAVCSEYNLAVTDDEVEDRLSQEAERISSMGRDASHLHGAEARQAIARTLLQEKYFDQINQLVGYNQK